MVSQELTELEEGAVQWKPEPKDMPDSGKGPWKSYQIKVNDKYFDCNQKTYNAVQENDNIKFTFSTTSFVFKQGQRQGETGYRYKVANLIGPAAQSQDNAVVENSPAAPEPAPTESAPPAFKGSIGRGLPGAEFGMLYKAAIEECQRVATAKRGTDHIYPDDIEAMFMHFLRTSLYIKYQGMPARESDPVPLQDDVPVSSDDEPDFADRDPSEAEEG